VFSGDDEGRVLTFTWYGRTYYALLIFIGAHPYLVDEDGALWRMEGTKVFKVNE
jgi:hypothetical protein